MTEWLFTLITLLGSALAGFFGALTGLGGGMLVVPLLTLALGVDIHYALGASLISVIATSSGASAAYVKKGYTNLRIAMFLGIATTFGAVVGALLTLYAPKQLISLVFGIVLAMSVLVSFFKHADATSTATVDKFTRWLRLDGHYPSSSGIEKFYIARRAPFGFILMWIAGLLSGLLGIGSGVVKVLAMDQVMQLPYKVATTTSNLMIGVTAAASAGLYLAHGYILPSIAMPVILGVLSGALIGAKVLLIAKPRILRRIFTVIVIIIALQMIYNGVAG